MLSINDVLEIMAAGGELPQQKLTAPTEAQIGRLQEVEPDLINEIVTAPDDADPAVTLMLRIDALSDELGWYPVASILCITFAHRYTVDTVPTLNLEGTPAGTVGLLRMFALSAQETQDEGAWTIPLAMLAELGRKEAQLVTVCAGFCAAVGHLNAVPAAGGQA